MNKMIDSGVGQNFTMFELNEHDIEQVSGGFAHVAVATAVVALGGAALDFGYKLGGMLYRATH